MGRNEDFDMLNPKQLEAAEAGDGPVLVVAGAGSGKTRTIAHRVAYLIKERGVSAANIVAVTFTRKAAGEMQDRLYSMIGQQAVTVNPMTFHAMGLAILRKNGFRRWTVSDDLNTFRNITRCLKESGVDVKEIPPADVKTEISHCKNNLIPPQEYRSDTFFTERVRRIYVEYQAYLESIQQFDFDDLLMKTVNLLENDPEVLELYQSRVKHLLIDEFQDTNIAQYRLAQQLSGGTRNIYVVGDPDQSIYAFRSADIRNILNFEQDYPDALVVKMEQNYRSTKTILEAAHSVIQHNTDRVDKELWTNNEKGLPVVTTTTMDSYAEALYVADEIESIVSSNGLTHKDCAVLYRTHAQSRALEEVFIRRGIPYKVSAFGGFFGLFEVKVLMSYMRILHNPNDDTNMSYIINKPARGIGYKSLGQLVEAAQKDGVSLWEALNGFEVHRIKYSIAQESAIKFAEMINDLRSKPMSATAILDALVSKLQYKNYITALDNGFDRWDNVIELRNATEECDTLFEFIDKVVMTLGALDHGNHSANESGTTLSTLHQAKGLEFPVVFMVGVEDGVLPHFRSFTNPKQHEEECRLCYVGMTRAMKRLYMLRATSRGDARNPVSPFALRIPEHLQLAKTIESPL